MITVSASRLCVGLRENKFYVIFRKHFKIIVMCRSFLTVPSSTLKKPSSLSAQWATWSEYNHSNTFKVLIGVAPNGQVTFVTRLWGGNTSDRHITMHDSLLQSYLLVTSLWQIRVSLLKTYFLLMLA